MTSAYDQVRYPTFAKTATHPARLGALGVLLGRRVSAPARCRVLEIGCGDGMNLLSMAATATESRFVGFDYCAPAIAEGLATARAAGIRNVELVEKNILDATPGLGNFDYIIAHGVYAWVPAPVRDAVMALIGRHLAPDGLAFLSYNTVPGCHVRRIVRDLLQDAVRGIAGAQAQIAAARDALEFFAAQWTSPDPLLSALRRQAEETLKHDPAVLFHDELGDVYEPQLVSDVAAHAAANGLQYLCDARPRVNMDAFFPREESRPLFERAGGDWVRFEQLRDYAALQGFRETILCRADGPVARRAEPARLRMLHAVGEFSRAATDAAGAEECVYLGANDIRTTTTDPRLAALLERIDAAYPGSIPLENEDVEGDVGESLLLLHLAGSLELLAQPLPCLQTPGARPQASALARVQAGRGDRLLCSLRHTPVEITDAMGLHFITLLDGSRTREELAAAMAAAAGQPVAAAAERLQAGLQGFCRAALLTA